MRRPLGAGLAVLLAVRVAQADPASPQLDAVHLQREDAQRIDRQQRRVEPDAPATSTTSGTDGEPLAPPPPPSAKSSRTTGIVLIGVGATAAVLSTSLFTVDAFDTDSDHPSRNTIAALLGVAAATVVVAGVAFLVTAHNRAKLAQQALQFAPTATPDSVGLAAVGRF